MSDSSISFSLPGETSTTAAETTATPTSTPETTTSTTSTTPSSTSTSTTPASTTTASSTTPSTTSTTPSSTVASSTAPSTTAGGTTTAPSSSTAAPTSSTSTLFVTAPNGSTFTSFIIQTGTQTASTTPTAGASANRSSTSFFDNKGAVAGTFTAVGVVALVLLIFLTTRLIRRRREKKFDAEIDEAAAEAAAAGANPDFADDYDYSSRSNATGGIGGGAYSETSHGTLAQPPLGHGGEEYKYANFADVGALGGAAGVGAGAMARAKSQRSIGDGNGFNNVAPSHPPAPMPGTETYEMNDVNNNNSNLRYRRSTGPYQYDPILGGYGAGDDPYAIARGPSVRYPSNPNLQRSGSQGRILSPGAGVNQPGQPFVPPGYPTAQTQAPLPPLPPHAQTQYAAGPEYGEPYGGGLDALPNPHSAAAAPSPPAASSQAALVGRHSTDDERDVGEYEGAYAVGGEEESEDEEGGDERNPRVLRVANE